MFQPPDPTFPQQGRGKNRIRVLIAEYFQEIQAKWIASLASEDDIELVGTASTGKQAVQMAVSIKPDIAILALRMPELDGPQAALQISQEVRNTGIILVGYGYREEDRQTAAKAGATILLEEPVPVQELVAAVRNLAFSHSLQPSLRPTSLLTIPALETRIYNDMVQNQEISQKVRRIIFDAFEKTLAKEQIVLSRLERVRLVRNILKKILDDLMGD